MPYGQDPGCVAAVEPLPGNGIGQPMVGAAVDHHGVGAELGGELVRLAVRQREEDHVVAGQDLRRWSAR